MIKGLTQACISGPACSALKAVFWAGNTVAARLAIDQISPFILTTSVGAGGGRSVAVYGGEIRKH
jgi:hypothetical protein